jgi:hypothetical protein
MAHAREAGDRQVISQRQQDEAGRDLYGRVQALLDAIGAEVAAGGLSPVVRGRLEWYADELREAKRNRDVARAGELEAALAAEDLGPAVDDGGEVLDGEVVYDSGDQDTEAAVEGLPLVADYMRRALGLPPAGAGRLALPMPGYRNPAEQFRDSLRQSRAAGPGPLVRHLPGARAIIAAGSLQPIPAQAVPGNGDLIAAAAEDGYTGAELVAIALGRHPSRAHVPPVGAQAPMARRIVPLPWRRRRALTS